METSTAPWAQLVLSPPLIPFQYAINNNFLSDILRTALYIYNLALARTLLLLLLLLPSTPRSTSFVAEKVWLHCCRSTERWPQLKTGGIFYETTGPDRSFPTQELFSLRRDTVFTSPSRLFHLRGTRPGQALLCTLSNVYVSFCRLRRSKVVKYRRVERDCRRGRLFCSCDFVKITRGVNVKRCKKMALSSNRSVDISSHFTYQYVMPV